MNFYLQMICKNKKLCNYMKQYNTHRTRVIKAKLASFECCRQCAFPNKNSSGMKQDASVTVGVPRWFGIKTHSCINLTRSEKALL